MQGLSSYYEYEQVICISKRLLYSYPYGILTPLPHVAMNEYRDLRIYRSSNRLIAMEEIKRVCMNYDLLDPDAYCCTTRLDRCRHDNKQTVWHSCKAPISKVFSNTNTKRRSANKRR